MPALARFSTAVLAAADFAVLSFSAAVKAAWLWSNRDLSRSAPRVNMPTRRAASMSPLNSATCLPSAAFQRRTMLFAPAEAIRAPSGRTETDVTGPPCSSFMSSLPELSSQTRTLPSSPPETKRFASDGTAATLVTAPEWPEISRGSVERSDQTRIMPSATAAMICEPSVLKAISLTPAAVSNRSTRRRSPRFHRQMVRSSPTEMSRAESGEKTAPRTVAE